MNPSQDEVFSAGEGDRWYERNCDWIFGYWNPITDWPCRLLSLYSLDPHIVVEVGCAGGHRLAYLSKGYDRHCIGIDASNEAIHDGRRLYPDVEFHHSLATDLPILSNTADCVIVHFVYHWLNRESLLMAASEVDRILKTGAYLILGDFAPDVPTKVAYKHREGLWTWKLPDSYASLWLSTGGYREVARITYDHDEREDRADTDTQRRAACVLLRKESIYQ